MTTLKFLAGAVAFAMLAGGSSNVSAAGREDCDAVAQKVRAQIATACPCDEATGHSGHVRCVTAKLRELSECKRDAGGNKACGPVPRQCLGAIRRVASLSTCGRPELVTCCMPRQHDCRNDPTPGDGKAEGICARTKKSCDKVDDCLIPRCQRAPTAESCVQSGGTVGKSSDCNTACAL